jgi:hypothetical protein
MGRDVQRTANLIGNLVRSLALTAAVAGLEWASPGVSARVFTEAERAEAFVNIILGVSGGASLARQSARMVVEEARGPILAALWPHRWREPARKPCPRAWAPRMG